jgi:hypothetical protein
VELLLNSLWLSVSVALVLFWVRATFRGETEVNWTAVVAIVLLMALLLPIISITDDLIASDSPTESEHVVRRGEMPLLHLTPDAATLPEMALLTALLFLGYAVLLARLSRFTLRFSPRVPMEGFARIAGVRPPPAAMLAA